MKKLILLAKSRTVRMMDLLQEGGAWLGAARSWIQWNANNGSIVKWSTEDHLHLKVVTVGEIERLAAEIAANVINEYKERLMTEGQYYALREYNKKENWRTFREGDAENPTLRVFDPDKDKMHWQMSFMHTNGWDLTECVDDPDTAKERKWPKTT